MAKRTLCTANNVINMKSTHINTMNLFTNNINSSPRTPIDIIWFNATGAINFLIPSPFATPITIESAPAPFDQPAWTVNSPVGSPSTISSNTQPGSMLLVPTNNVILSSSSASPFTFLPQSNPSGTFLIQSNGLYLQITSLSSDSLLGTTSNRSQAQNFRLRTSQ